MENNEANETEEYLQFVEKFKPKKTTDDCYTPEPVYDAVLDWVRNEYNIADDVTIVRPFYPGGDYEDLSQYPDGCVVVDNPPFSILTKICRYYSSQGIRYFLFAPALTLLGSNHPAARIAVGANITYENKAKVLTSFVTNLEECMIRTAPALFDAIDKANYVYEKSLHNRTPKYEYPSCVATSARIQLLSKYGVDYRIEVGQAVKVARLDSQKEQGKSIFGNGLLLSSKAEQELLKAEALKQQRKKREQLEFVWNISERELEMQRELDEASTI